MNPTDQDLLEQFRLANDQAAFEQLVQRHGPMVMGVCRRILGNEPDAWDAFQTVFLLLARRAESLQKHPVISGWLYQTAIYTAKNAKGSLLRRSIRFQPLEEHMQEATPEPGKEWEASLDEEIQRLPDKYRFPVILCHVEKRTYEEAAEELKLSYAVLRHRLYRATDLLRSRLLRRGIGVTGAAMGMLLAKDALAQVPVNTVVSTAKTASSLAAGTFAAGGMAAAEAGLIESGVVSTKVMALLKAGLKTIWIQQLKSAALIGLVSLGAGAAGLAGIWHLYTKEPSAVAQKEAVMPADDPNQNQRVFKESFESSGFVSRGWYDGTGIAITTKEHLPGGSSSAEFRFLKDQQDPSTGTALRRRIPASEAIRLSYWVKRDPAWPGSVLASELRLMTNKNSDWQGPGYTYLTVTLGVKGGKPVVLVQDGQNLDSKRLGQDLTDRTEARAVAGGNGDSDGYGEGDWYLMEGSPGTYNNCKSWPSEEACIGNEPGPYYQGDWHHVEAFVELNSIVDGKAVADGKLKYWYDGKLVIDHEDVVLRTAVHADMKFNQLLIAPYVHGGSPDGQILWLDDLAVASESGPGGEHSLLRTSGNPAHER